jgi:hypothetical protein
MFTADKLEWARTRTKATEGLHRSLLERGVISETGPNKLGVLVDLDRDYKSLLDLPVSTAVANRLFFRLLDVRVMVGAMRGALELAARSFPADLGDLRIDVNDGDGRTEALVERLGGPTGAGLLEYARVTERAILNILNALIATDVEEIPEGHGELFALDVLAHASLNVAGVPIAAQPLIMFDDGHGLARSQRDALLTELKKRRPAVARWYSERFEALSEQELIGGIEEGRDVLPLNIDTIAREGDGRRFVKSQYERVLADIATKRAAGPLSQYSGESQPFLDLMQPVLEESDHDFASIVDVLQARVLELVAGEGRYKAWLGSARQLSGHEAAIRWRELEVLVLRDQNRQPDLFGEPLAGSDLVDRSSASVREGAALAVAQEFNLPYYFGTNTILRLGSHNAQQFLSVCGQLFSEMLVDVSLGRAPRLSPARQHRVLRATSEAFWESIPRSIPYGRDVQTLVGEIVEIARVENAKPRMPYPPGVTGTALLMSERNLLLQEDYREREANADRLFHAIGSAVAHNVLHADMDYSVKGNRYMVLYINRLLCPRFQLPLGLGGFKERRLPVMIKWMQKTPAIAARRVPEPDRLDL